MSYDLHWISEQSIESQRLKDVILSFSNTSPNSDKTFCIDGGRDLFVAVSISENQPPKISINFAFGGDITETTTAIGLCAHLKANAGGRIFDPQAGREVDLGQPNEIIRTWHRSNLAALENYSDGKCSIREIVETKDGKIMIEARKYDLPTALNVCLVAIAYAKVEEYKKALKLFEKARDLDSNNPQILYSIGLTHFNMGDRKKAVKPLREALKLDRDNEMVKQLLSDCLK